jgi:hypothetical protein
MAPIEYGNTGGYFYSTYYGGRVKRRYFRINYEKR